MTFGKITICLSPLIVLLSSCDIQTDSARVENLTGWFADGLSNRKLTLRSGSEQIDETAGVLAVQRESGGQTAGLGLVSRRANIETWSTLDGTTLTLDGGLVIGTAGFGPDLFSAEVDPIRSRPLGQPTSRIHRYVDGENHLRLEAYVCEVSVDHAKPIAWGGRVIISSRFDETCTGSSTSFENFFLYSRSGRLLGSKQWIGSKMGYIILQMPNPDS